MASGGGTVGTDPARATYTVPELTCAKTTAHDFGLPTTAHCRASDAMERAIDAGLDCMEHGEFIAADGARLRCRAGEAPGRLGHVPEPHVAGERLGHHPPAPATGPGRRAGAARAADPGRRRAGHRDHARAGRAAGRDGPWPPHHRTHRRWLL